MDKIVSKERKAEVIRILENEVADNLPFLEAATPLSLERFRFAVLKVAGNNPDKLAQALTLAKEDWRDLLIAAEFADSVEAHETWAMEKYGL